MKCTQTVRVDEGGQSCTHRCEQERDHPGAVHTCHCDFAWQWTTGRNYAVVEPMAAGQCVVCHGPCQGH